MKCLCLLHHWQGKEKDAESSQSKAPALAWWLFVRIKCLSELGDDPQLGEPQAEPCPLPPLRSIIKWNCASRSRPRQRCVVLALPLRAVSPRQGCPCHWGCLLRAWLHPQQAAHRDPRAGSSRGTDVPGESRAEQRHPAWAIVCSRPPGKPEKPYLSSPS